MFKVQRVGLRVSGFRVKAQRLKRQTELKGKEGQLAAVINAASYSGGRFYFGWPLFLMPRLALRGASAMVRDLFDF